MTPTFKARLNLVAAAGAFLGAAVGLSTASRSAPEIFHSPDAFGPGFDLLSTATMQPGHEIFHHYPVTGFGEQMSTATKQAGPEIFHHYPVTGFGEQMSTATKQAGPEIFHHYPVTGLDGRIG